MTQIADAKMLIAERTPETVRIMLRAFIRFSEPDLSSGQAGDARFRLYCTVWDDDLFFDNRVVRANRRLDVAEIRSLSRIIFSFTVPYARLREMEFGPEAFIELFGEFRLMRNGVQRCPVVRTPTVDVSLQPPFAAAAISALLLSPPGGPELQVFGVAFAPNASVRVTWTDSAFTNSVVVTTNSQGVFTMTVPVTCSPALRIAVSASEVDNPAVTATDAFGAVCPG